MRIWIAGVVLVSACTEAVPVATKVEPVQAAPVAPAVKTPPVVDGGPTPALACDLTGTWAIEVLPQDDEGCAGLKDEKLTLALGFTAGPSGTRLASAAQAVEGGDGLARMLPAIRSARVVEPRLECGLRVDLGPGADATSHAQLLLQLERGGAGRRRHLVGRGEGQALRAEPVGVREAQRGDAGGVGGARGDGAGAAGRAGAAGERGGDGRGGQARGAGAARRGGGEAAGGEAARHAGRVRGGGGRGSEVGGAGGRGVLGAGGGARLAAWR
jgi:hypothetical protein